MHVGLPDMEIPTVSVVMGVYNASENIESTISSLLGQEEIALELIVVDDGSTDNTADHLAAMAQQDSRINLIRRPHRGLTVSLAEACDLARVNFWRDRMQGIGPHLVALENKWIAYWSIALQASVPVMCDMWYLRVPR